MEIEFIGSNSPSACANRRFEQLIATIGTSSFGDALTGYAIGEFRCSHVTAFAYSKARQPRVVLAVDRGEPSLARRIATKYIQEYWHLDPANRILESEPRVGAGALLRLRYEEIDNPAYRQDCYRQIQLVDRFSLIKSHGKDLIRLNVYRDSTKGRFADVDLQHLAKISGALLQIVVKHDQLRPSQSDQERLEKYCSKLQTCIPHLSDREIEICSEIVIGRTSEAIAKKLGLSINTILTHRKRAYSKLAISSQNELSRIVLQ